MGKLLILQKKRFNKMKILISKIKKKEDFTEKRKKTFDKTRIKIIETQKKARKLLKKLKKYKQERVVSAACVYIQF